MTDIERAFGNTPPPTRRPFRGWKPLSQVLLVAFLLAAGVGLVQTWRYAHDLKAEVKAAVQASEMKLARITQEQAALAQALMEEKGKAIARSFRMVNPDIVSDDGQEIAQDLLDEMILSDPNIAFVAVLDNTGAVCATTDPRLKRDDPPIGVTRIVVNKPGAHGADAEILGPITDVYNTQIGVVRVGIDYGDAATPHRPAPETPRPEARPDPDGGLPPPTPPSARPESPTDLNST